MIGGNQTSLRQQLWRSGYSPIPCEGKRPAPKAWEQKIQTNLDEIALWEKVYGRASNTGILTRLTPAIDIDITDEVAAEAVEALARERFEESGYFLVRIGKAPKRAVLLRTDVPFPKITRNLTAPNDTTHKIELLCDGQQIIVFGEHPETNRPYTWHGGEPGAVPLDELPYVNQEAALQFANDAVAMLVREYGYTVGNDRPAPGAGVAPGGQADWSWLIGNLQNGRELHDSGVVLASKLITSGMSDGAAVNMLRGIYESSGTPRDDRWQERYDEIPRSVESARRKFGLAEVIQLRSEAEEKPPQTVTALPYQWTDPGKIPLRDWLYGRLMVRRYLSVTIAPGGVGKSSLIAGEALAMVSGRNLLGVKPARKLKVWLWNLEDPQEETTRKVQAAAKHFNLQAQDLQGRLFINSGRDYSLVIAKETRNGTIVLRPVVDNLGQQVREHGIDILVIDPFVSCHEVSENDNSAIDMIAKEWSRVAELANCGIHLVHHTRKAPAGTEVTTDSSRGAKALTDAARVARTLNQMSEEEGAKAGIDNHRLYFRAVNDKANLAPPVTVSDWFKLVSVWLMNGPVNGDVTGDSVGVVTQWEWPDALAGITGLDFEKAAAVIRKSDWRKDVQSRLWVGNAVAKALGLDVEDKADKAKIMGLLKVWILSGSLRVVEGKDERRRSREFVQVCDAE